MVYANCVTLFGIESVSHYYNREITCEKDRYYVDGHLLFRGDSLSRSDLYHEEQEHLEINLAAEIHTADMVLIADYGKGTITERVLSICNGAKRVILDPHISRVPYKMFKPTTYMPNRHEWKKDRRMTPAEHVIVTSDKDGVVVHRDGDSRTYPSHNSQPNTVIGAGGAFMAAYAFASLHKPRFVEAIEIKFALDYVAEAMTSTWQCINSIYKVEEDDDGKATNLH